MSYPYFAATLPLQRFGEGPAMSLDAFRASCAEHLSASDNAALAALLDGGENRHSYVRAWRVSGRRVLRSGRAAIAVPPPRPTHRSGFIRTKGGVLRLKRRLRRLFRKRIP